MVQAGTRLSRHTEPIRDERTRHLCAAAHLSRDFADAALRELLVEPTRAVPTTTDVDASAVLTEALAARMRTNVVDVLVLLALGASLYFAQAMTVLWIFVAVVLSLPKLIRLWHEVRARRGTGHPIHPIRLAISSITVLLAIWAVTSTFGLGVVLTLLNPFDEDDPVDIVLALIAFMLEEAHTEAAGYPLLAAALLVLLVNRLIVAHHVTLRFGPSRHNAPPPVDRVLLRLAPRLAERIRERHRGVVRVAPDASEQDDLVPLLVYRGYKPFVGAGDIHEPWTVAVPLERRPDAPRTDLALDTARLLEGITAKVTGLRAASPLAPSARLGALTADDCVIVTAQGLVDHLSDVVSAHYLRRPDQPPYTHVTRAHADLLRDHPLEWSRFYRRFTLDTWDNDLVVSVFVHVAMDDSTLYLEWTTCVLRPVSAELKVVDAESASPWVPVGRALKDLVLMPASAVSRVVRLITHPRAHARRGGRVDADRYGSLMTLREMAADTELHAYFQQADVERYTRLLRSRVTLAVSEILREAGFHTASFDRQAQSIVNTVNTINTVTVADGGTVAGPVLQGGSLTGDVDITG
ncbi:MAG: hypothetical protein HOV94_38205 [Saccharothrix sp.]|nr:hypothetical protein [Saccharothrix sp.]